MYVAPDVDMTSEAIIAGAVSPINTKKDDDLIQQLASAPRNAVLRHPHLRRLYLIFFVVVSLLVLLPTWTLLYLPRRNRPRQSWTLQRCLRVRWSRRLCALVAKCEIDYLGRDLNLDFVSDTCRNLYGSAS